MSKHKILITNDDGISAPGLHSLVFQLVAQNKYDIRVCAPEKEQSAVSHAITVRKPLFSEEFEMPHDISSVKACKTSGTPADCIRLALGTNILDDFKPDLILSGINRGNNSGLNVIYSGTVGGAIEGACYGIPSLALSLNHPPTYPSAEDEWPFDIAAQECIAVIDTVLAQVSKNEFLKTTVLNVNFPNVKNRSEIKGTRITQQGRSRFFEHFKEATLSHGSRRCFTLLGEMKTIDTSLEYDTYAIDHGWIAITPLSLRCDLQSDGETVGKIGSWFNTENTPK